VRRLASDGKFDELGVTWVARKVEPDLVGSELVRDIPEPVQRQRDSPGREVRKPVSDVRVKQDRAVFRQNVCAHERNGPPDLKRVNDLLRCGIFGNQPREQDVRVQYQTK
jgi:hypothetical protein